MRETVFLNHPKSNLPRDSLFLSLSPSQLECSCSLARLEAFSLSGHIRPLAIDIVSIIYIPIYMRERLCRAMLCVRARTHHRQAPNHCSRARRIRAYSCYIVSQANGMVGLSSESSLWETELLLVERSTRETERVEINEAHAETLNPFSYSFLPP